MFTGLVETLGIVKRIETAGAGRRLCLEAACIAAALSVGESVAVNGACLTVIAHDAQTCTLRRGDHFARVVVGIGSNRGDHGLQRRQP